MKLIIITIVCILAFWPAFSAGFLQFDDPQHIFLNPAVLGSLPDSLNLIFTQSVNKIYLPLTTLTFALEKHFFGLNPFIFHFNNILLHILVCITILFFLNRLKIHPMAAFFTVLIFAVHPMKVESVAWVTERKDVLYSLFYVLAMIAYIDYTQKKSKISYALAIVWALCSILSKPMALSLPLILLLLDWYLRRGLNVRIILEKLPFVLIAGGIGWITYAQNMRPVLHDLGAAFCIWIWSCSFYIWKFFTPFHVYAFYKLPEPVSLTSWVYLGSILFFSIWILSLCLWRRKRLYLLASGFYFFSIFFLFRFDVGVDASIVNDRFMYLPGLGFCVLLGILCQKLVSSRIGRVAVLLVIILLIFKTHEQTKIWRDNLSFYNEVIRAYPDAFSAYNNRAHYYYQTGQLNLALSDYNKAIEIAPRFARNYIGRGTVWGMLGNPTNAVADFSAALTLDPTLAEAYFNRSIAANSLQQKEQALSDALKAQNLGLPVPALYIESLK